MTTAAATTPHSTKNFGLDFVRACAVMMVVVYHFGYLHAFAVIDSTPTNKWLHPIDFLAFIGISAVSIFFVLSGLLIGQIIFRDLIPAFDEPKVLQKIGQFYIRRWLRTIPPYYAALTSIAAIYFFQGRLAEMSYSWKDYLFLQDNALRFVANAILGVSWTLAAEEWFYVMLPLAFLLLHYKGLPRFLLNHISLPERIITYATNLLLITVVAGPCLGIMRLILGPQNIYAHPFHWLLFESLPIGVLLAFLKLYRHGIYAAFRHPCTIALGWIIVALVGYYFSALSHSFMDTYHQGRFFMQPWLNISWMTFIAASEHSRLLNLWAASKPFFKRIITHIAKWSYSLYLVHFSCIQWADKITPNPWFAVPLSLVLIGVFTTLLYRLVERPCMQWREKVA